MSAGQKTRMLIPKAAWIARFAIKLEGIASVKRSAAIALAERCWENMCVMHPEDAALLYVKIGWQVGRP